MSAPITLNSLRPLIHDTQVSGRRLTVQFRCPRTETIVRANWTAPAKAAAGGQLMAHARRSAWYEVRRQLYRTLRSILGRGVVGSVASRAVSNAVASPSSRRASASPLSKREQSQGIIEAFHSVASQFVWVDGQWVHASALTDLLSPFDAQLSAHPIRSGYDRRVLARILAEVAAADGGIDELERALIEELLDEGQSLDAVLANPPLTPAELDETQPGESRISLLAIAWTVALCDDDLAPEEARLLDRFADGLRLGTAQRNEARLLGYDSVLNQLLEQTYGPSGYDAAARERLYTTGQRLGLDEASIQRAEARFRKRKGI